MVLRRRPGYSLLWTIASFIALGLGFVYWISHSQSHPDYHISSFSLYFFSAAETMADATSSLVVSARQTGTSSPPKVTFGVTNMSPRPVTVLAWESPLDPLALQLGRVAVTPSGGGRQPLDFPTVQVRRRMPPGPDDLVTIEPGETAENEVVLREALLPPERLGSRATAVCRGSWAAVWPGLRAADVDERARAELGANKDAVKGSYESEPLEIEVEVESWLGVDATTLACDYANEFFAAASFTFRGYNITDDQIATLKGSIGGDTAPADAAKRLAIHPAASSTPLEIKQRLGGLWTPLNNTAIAVPANSAQRATPLGFTLTCIPPASPRRATPALASYGAALDRASPAVFRVLEFDHGGGKEPDELEAAAELSSGGTRELYSELARDVEFLIGLGQFLLNAFEASGYRSERRLVIRPRLVRIVGGIRGEVSRVPPPLNRILTNP
ncbi:hypothetical protein DL766_005746 [Monosporascus sp. MC13-8B]|uniref:Uncharacterized protein n=1 Tax=Monosporascus cannonballus TaxID=155416 RepID=A0ABY0GWP9_9PEZI|nr:hypothetical protein DL762_009834 [Monosporascus cannonballus]RYO78247.1 hypothetical protein DL763_009722 [Monosporascus cannonballus]RYP28671.1 hypothetical protein DL766_005746 [Monosporascus sp. MC13-8B]